MNPLVGLDDTLRALPCVQTLAIAFCAVVGLVFVTSAFNRSEKQLPIYQNPTPYSPQLGGGIWGWIAVGVLLASIGVCAIMSGNY